LFSDTFFKTRSIKNQEEMMKHKRIFSLLGVAVATVALLAVLMTSMALAHDNILAHVHMPLQPIDADGNEDAESVFANFHIFSDDRAEGSIQWKDTNSQGILHLQNGQVNCVENRPTFDLLGTLSTGPRSGEPDLIRYVAARVTPIRYTPEFTCTHFPGPYQCAAFTIEVDPAVYDNIDATGLLAFDVNPCE
jgi:hypothetical protein